MIMMIKSCKGTKTYLATSLVQRPPSSVPAWAVELIPPSELLALWSQDLALHRSLQILHLLSYAPVKRNIKVTIRNQ